MASPSAFPRSHFVAGAAFSAAPGNSVRMDDLAAVARRQRLCQGQHGARRRRLRGARRHSRSLSTGRAGADPARFLRRHAGIDPRLRSRDSAQHRSVARARSCPGQRSAADERDDPPLPPGLCERVRRAAGAAMRSTRRSARADAPSASNIGCRCSTSAWTRCSIMSATRRSSSTRAPRMSRARASPRSPIILRLGGRR